MAASSARTATTTPVAMSTTSAAVNPGGGGVVRYVTNLTAAILYLRMGTAAAVATDYTISLAAGAVWENPAPFYNGPIQGILASGSGNINVTSY